MKIIDYQSDLNACYPEFWNASRDEIANFEKTKKMPHTIIRIDNRSKKGRSLVELAKQIASSGSGVEFLTETELEQKEDDAISKMITQARKTGFVSPSAVKAKLKRIRKKLEGWKSNTGNAFTATSIS